ncbi:MAG TPA: tetratricopeptide repeat protein [Luteimonas sp.]|mgnify:CR=1 FL=1|nr:tetratricopeptide repeat protein [Luteimonas sp.]
MMTGWLLAAALALSPEAAPLPPPPPVVAEAPVPAEQVMAIPAPLREALQAQVIDRSPRGTARLQRLAAFLLGEDGLGIRYRHDADHTVAEVWRTREANCLSFTLFTIALARAAGLDAYGQEIARTLSWYSEGDTLYFSNHVNAGIRIAPHGYTIDVASDSVLTRDPPRRVDDRRLLANFYSNRAANLLAGGRLAEASAFIDAAFAADAGHATTWNNAGVLQLRSGRPDLAERDFLRAIELDKRHDSAMMNLASLYATRGDEQRAAHYRKRIEHERERNPFHFFMRGTESEKRGDYADAAKQYRRAIQLYDEEHRFHFGLARAYLHLGEPLKAGQALQRAHDLTKGDLRNRYQAKLDVLRRQMP